MSAPNYDVYLLVEILVYTYVVTSVARSAFYPSNPAIFKVQQRDFNSGNSIQSILFNLI